ncbi:MAG TPA: hypothetical protein VJ019_03315 [Aestuariivirga sp.]|jgi:hypothetical protein|nr:hypothetical protein [Aestuariivirga sp.]
MRKIIMIALAFGMMSTTALADCKADLQNVIDGHLKSGPYHADITVTADGNTMKFSGDIILPDQFHMTMPQAEMIKTTAGMWMKMAGKWQALPASVAKTMQSPIDQGIAEGLKNVENLACLGAQTYENQNLIGFEFDSHGEVGGSKGTAHTVMYVDPATNLPAWVIINGEAMGKKSTTTQHLTFDSSITITAPK